MYLTTLFLLVLTAVAAAHQGAHSFLELMRQQCNSWCEMNDSASIAPRLGKAGPPGLRGPQGPPGVINTTKVEEIVSRKVGKLEADLKVSELERRLRIVEAQLMKLNESRKVESPGDCNMGMKSGRILDGQISASSIYNSGYQPPRARLNTQRTDSAKGCWAPKRAAAGEWIQVDLLNKQSVAGITTQGCNGETGRLTSYKVECDSVTVKEQGTDKIFTGNTDSNTNVTRKFPTPLNCQTVRIVVVTYNAFPELRFELINGACFDII